MVLLPGEQGLSPIMIGLRLASRDAVMRAGRPYAIVGNEEPVSLPWWAWVAVGGAVIGLARLVFVRRGGRDEPAYVLVDRDPGAISLPPAVHPLSSDAELIQAFDRDAARLGGMF